MISCDKCSIKDLELVKENGNFYLSATYLMESKEKKYEITIPRIALYISNEFPMVNVDSTVSRVPAVTIDLGFGELPVLADSLKTWYIQKTIFEELTISEIENRLGYKVKIVGE